MTQADLASHVSRPQYFRHRTHGLLPGDQPSQGDDWPQVQSALNASMGAGQVIKTERALGLWQEEGGEAVWARKDSRSKPVWLSG